MDQATELAEEEYNLAFEAAEMAADEMFAEAVAERLPPELARQALLEWRKLRIPFWSDPDEPEELKIAKQEALAIIIRAQGSILKAALAESDKKHNVAGRIRWKGSYFKPQGEDT